MTQPLSNPAGSIFQTNGIIAPEGEKVSKSVRAFDTMEMREKFYVKPMHMPPVVVALTNITGFPAYKRGTKHDDKPIEYTLPNEGSFKLEVLRGDPYPTVQNFIYLQSLISHFAYHCVETGIHPIQLSDHLKFLGKDVQQCDARPLVNACTRYMRSHATYVNSWKVFDADGNFTGMASKWASNYITRSSFVIDDESKVISQSLNDIFKKNKKPLWVQFHPDIVTTIVSLARANRNRLFSRYLFSIDTLCDDAKAIYCYLWTFGDKCSDDKFSQTRRNIETLMCGLSYHDRSTFVDWFEHNLNKLKAIDLLSYQRENDMYFFRLTNLSKLSRLSEFIHFKGNSLSSYQKAKHAGPSLPKGTKIAQSEKNLLAIKYLSWAGLSVIEIVNLLKISKTSVYDGIRSLKTKGEWFGDNESLSPSEAKKIFERSLPLVFLDESRKDVLQAYLENESFLAKQSNMQTFMKSLFS